jgi:hypothetical protein
MPALGAPIRRPAIHRRRSRQAREWRSSACRRSDCGTCIVRRSSTIAAHKATHARQIRALGPTIIRPVWRRVRLQNARLEYHPKLAGMGNQVTVGLLGKWIRSGVGGCSGARYWLQSCAAWYPIAADPETALLTFEPGSAGLATLRRA